MRWVWSGAFAFLIAAGAAAGGIAADAEPGAASSGHVAGSGRDAVWRSIFARPAAGPAGPGRPASPQLVALGAALFQDTRLSGDNTRACASCHNPALGFTDGLPKALANDGTALSRNAPTLINAGWGQRYFWDGRAGSLEEQARVPMTAPNEMAGTFPEIIARLSADPAMARRFAEAFPSAPEITEAGVLAAIAAYERTIVAPPTRFDTWVAGDDAALSALERAGFDLFVGRAGCVACHGGWRFTDDGFHDIGLPGADPGRGAVPGGNPGVAQFKTPTLRELLHTAPYMHDGSKATLRAVVDHYGGGLEKRASVDANVVRDLALSDNDKAALVAFLATLSSPADH